MLPAPGGRARLYKPDGPLRRDRRRHRQSLRRPTEVCDDLTDIDYGAWQFKTLEEAKSENPKLFAAWFAKRHLIRFPSGESLQDLAARAGNALRFVLARHPDDTIVLVGDDSVNRALLMQLLDQPLAAYWRLAQSPSASMRSMSPMAEFAFSESTRPAIWRSS